MTFCPTPIALTERPTLRRFATQGFRHVPDRDAPDFGFICIENRNQRLFVNPETGYFRAGNAPQA